MGLPNKGLPNMGELRSDPPTKDTSTTPPPVTEAGASASTCGKPRLESEWPSGEDGSGMPKQLRQFHIRNGMAKWGRIADAVAWQLQQMRLWAAGQGMLRRVPRLPWGSPDGGAGRRDWVKEGR